MQVARNGGVNTTKPRNGKEIDERAIGYSGRQGGRRGVEHSFLLTRIGSTIRIASKTRKLTVQKAVQKRGEPRRGCDSARLHLLVSDRPTETSGSRVNRLKRIVVSPRERPEGVVCLQKKAIKFSKPIPISFFFLFYLIFFLISVLFFLHLFILYACTQRCVCVRFLMFSLCEFAAVGGVYTAGNVILQRGKLIFFFLVIVTRLTILAMLLSSLLFLFKFVFWLR